jgi:hypothetical protein
VGLCLEVFYDIAVFVEGGDKTGRALPVKVKRDSQKRGDVGVFGDRPKPAFTREALIEDDKPKTKERLLV